MSANLYTSDEATSINESYMPEKTMELIRYMDFSKFMNILTSGTLRFTNAGEFEDKYEGQMPEGFFKNWKESHVDSYKGLLERLDDKRNAYVSCWNDFSKTESYALWRIYTEPNSGVAIKTTVDKLANALNNSEICIYKAKYLSSFDDKDKDIELPFYFFGDSFIRVKHACKLEAYEYEREVRAILYKSEKSNGINIPVNLCELIEEIYISPYASSWFFNTVKDILQIEEFGLKDIPIVKSKILV